MGDHMEIGNTGLVPEKEGLFYDTTKKEVVKLEETPKEENPKED